MEIKRQTRPLYQCSNESKENEPWKQSNSTARKPAREMPGMAVVQAVDDHRVEAARIGLSQPETILELSLQAKRHGGRVDYYLDGVRMARERVLFTVTTRVVRDNNAEPAQSQRKTHMNDNQRDLLVRGGIYLVAGLICAAIFSVCWHYVGSRISLGFPSYSLGASLEFPIQLAANALLSMLIGFLFMGLTLTMPRHIRRKQFWRRKHAENAK